MDAKGLWSSGDVKMFRPNCRARARALNSILPPVQKVLDCLRPHGCQVCACLSRCNHICLGGPRRAEQGRCRCSGEQGKIDILTADIVPVSQEANVHLMHAVRACARMEERMSTFSLRPDTLQLHASLKSVTDQWCTCQSPRSSRIASLQICTAWSIGHSSRELWIERLPDPG